MEMRIKAKEEGKTTLGLESWVAQLGARAFFMPGFEAVPSQQACMHTSISWDTSEFLGSPAAISTSQEACEYDTGTCGQSSITGTILPILYGTESSTL
jgi:hypothetical protein